jgi:hypothetical protein
MCYEILRNMVDGCGAATIFGLKPDPKSNGPCPMYVLSIEDRIQRELFPRSNLAGVYGEISIFLVISRAQNLQKKKSVSEASNSIVRM